MRINFLIALSLFSLNCIAQQDYNWCFGANAGINFTNPDSFQIFRSKAYNSEINASISDENGQLLFYVGWQPSRFLLFDRNHKAIKGGDTLKVHGSMTNGLIILPLEDEKYYLFQINNEFSVTNCPANRCVTLYYTTIKKDGDSLQVISKNNLLLNGPIEEGMGAVQHANGKDWWLLVHERRIDNATSCTDKFYKLLISNSSIQIDSQTIGSKHCTVSASSGEMVFSKNGTNIASVITGDKKIEVFNFDRCIGELQNYRLVEDGSNNIYPYGCEFSPSGNYLYLTHGAGFGNDALYQYDLNSPNISATKKTIWVNNIPNVNYGQLQRASNGQIFLGLQIGGQPNFYNQNISRIEFPDSSGTACSFLPYSFYLGDSASNRLGLPNMPNSNLGALSIYQAEAGENQIFCYEDTTVKGLFIGSPAVQGVQYQWSPPVGIDTLTKSGPFVIPDSSRWYYVTFTDTSIQYSCQSRTDSVWVEVRDCSVGISPQSSVNSPQIKIYPNPASEIIYLSMPDTRHLILKTELWDVSGKLLHTYHRPSMLDISKYATGVYLLRISLKDGTTTYKKIIKN